MMRVLVWFEDGELVYRVIESDDKDEEVNRSFRVLYDFIIERGFCLFRPFTEVMLEEMIDDVSYDERKEEQQDCCDELADKRVNINSIVFEELIDEVAKVDKDVHKISHLRGNK
jgi:hypothetical protein